ncbi:MAG: GNAT family N-acetyltransferase [Bacteroidetes bacterium]|jgi:ribosomal protein S18 acetylase RimI-like enzyme|nr:GNAT family N-acetyltransferase [Bacteroidota bacterium]
MAVTTWYLEMRSREAIRPKWIDDPHLRILEATARQWEFNRFLYLAVGRDWAWNDKRAWTDEQWKAYAESPKLCTFIAYVDGSPAGYFELQRDDEGGVEIVYFGLMPAFIGRGLGAHLLTTALEEAWRMRPTRVWVHTCSLDHPGALKNYEARGMVLYRTDLAP